MKVLVPLIAYLLGNFNSGIIFSKLLYKKDIRALGSKNPGMTNAFRVLGKAAGVLVLVFDALKGVAAVALARWLLPQPLGTLDDFWPCLAALCVVIGHNWPVLFQFRGGKGVATTAGVTLFLQPPVLFLELIPFFLLLFGVKYMSLASIACGVLLPVMTLLWHGGQANALFWLSLALGLLIVFQHRANILRLLRHKENKLFQKKK
ncbi:MAG: glycerol-3-phosphate 1-O-acyltransferase PlsY [Oscillospiraceae bacterium]|jgi:glycerol-3-phosphate acyltransferase PlsY|nr:glycerol-3-phosphate 1-O-acyltransferase PlsY [Oscillospiraceae bacterium]